MLTSSSSFPLVKGMKLLSKEKVLNAYGLPKEFIPKEFQDFEQLYSSLPMPQCEDDWLAQYIETGQTISQWEKLWKKNHSTHLDTIYLIALGEFIPPFSNLLEELREYIELFFYGYTVKIVEPMKLITTVQRNKKTKYSVQISKFNYSSLQYEENEWIYELTSRRCHPYDKDKLPITHRQFSVHSLLHILNEMKPDNARAFCCVTMEDLFDGKTDSFVGGMAAGGSHVGCFSFHRYNPQFRLLSSLEDTPKPVLEEKELHRILLERSCKVLAHEIGHIFQLDHCIWFACCMNGSGNLQEDFRQPFHLCPIDLFKLQKATNCNIIERNRKLLSFYQKMGLEEQEKWMQQWLQTVEDSKEENNNTISQVEEQTKKKRGVKRKAEQIIIDISSEEE